MKFNLWFLLLLCCFGCTKKSDLPSSIELNNDWSFRNVTDSIWFNATVPGNVHSNLLENKLIPHPFIGNNEADLQWISETDWEYKTPLNLDEKTLQKKHIELHFEGLDTYASIFLNDSLILKTNNAFRHFKVDVKPLLKSENELRIVFENTTKHEATEKAKLPYELPEGNRVFTRKAQFQYGWDFGPQLNTSGIWRPAELVAWNDYKIKNIYVKQLTLEDSKAGLAIDISEISSLKDNLDYEVYLNDSLYYSVDKMPKYDSDKVLLPIIIKNPKRWWPHNLGTPYLYDIKVVVKKDNTILDSISVKKGLRTIELVTEKDSIGESFYFKVNGIPVYMKGANYIPQNSMQNLVTTADYEKLLSDVVDTNMNMLRVWGGGIYENDVFYDLCDEKGILVWQDFMFACAMYPGDKAFLENIQQEAIDNVKRLRNHASIALWCGNNEDSEGWKRWGWQANRSKKEKEEIWSNYLKVFDSILPKTVKRLTDTDYWESSPKYGRGNPLYKTEGDAHDWWIWHDGYPFEHLENNVPRFMSEFGFQSFPSYETLKYITQKDSISFSSIDFLSHQKHNRGFQLINDYMQRDFPVPDDAEDYVYISQLLQAYGITKGIEAQRRAKPYNMGTLYWQLNDCWPAVSWSSIDFFGNWKALQYKAKKAFENVLISSEVKNDTLKTFIINDQLKPQNGTLSLQILDFNGNELWSTSKEINVSKNSSELKHLLDLKTLQLKSDEVVVVSKFNNETSCFYLVKPKYLKLQKGEITKKISKTSSGFKIELSSTTLQKDVFLFTDEKDHFSDNFFDLLPNEPVEIEFETEAEIENLKDLKIKILNQFIH